MAQLGHGNEQQEPTQIYSYVGGEHHANVEEKQARTHDFLSCYGDNCAPNGATAENGLQTADRAPDVLQLMQTNMLPVSSISVPMGFVYDPRNGSGVHSARESETAFTLSSGRADMQASYSSLDICYTSRPHVPLLVSSTQWQQQQNQISFKMLDGNKRLARDLSEDGAKEDDGLLDQAYISKKEILHQKLDRVQQQQRWPLEGKSLDNKGFMSRSKHSATEQRRRSKINDRFQRLRKLLPNPDQKRDKASFLLEVVEYIQVLHEKVRRYEAMERANQPQEGGKIVSWDARASNSGTSSSKEQFVNVSRRPLAKILSYDVKGIIEADGYTAYQSSPLTGACENVKIDLNSVSGGATLNRLLQESVCLPSYDDNALVNKPMVVSFTAPISKSTEEQPNPILFVSGSQSFPDDLGSTNMSTQILYHKQQAAIKSNSSLFMQGEALSVAQAHSQLTGKIMTSNLWSFSNGSDHKKSKGAELSQVVLCGKAHNEQAHETLKSSPKKDVLVSRQSQGTGNKASQALDTEVDDKMICSTLQGLKGECKEKRLVDEEWPSAVLGGVIKISSPYSKGLLDALIQALQGSGIDLTEANMSVQIDLGNPLGSLPPTSCKEIAMPNAATVPGQSSSAKELNSPAKRPKVEPQG